LAPAILIVNLGTPASLETNDVSDFLDEFLMDRYVINLPWIARFLIVKGFILPFRPAKSAKAYQKIWDHAGKGTGSPILHYGKEVERQLEAYSSSKVRFAMRYGKPSLEDTIIELEASGVNDITLIPLFPQFAGSTWTTIVKKTESLISRETQLKVINPFFNNNDYLDAQAKSYRESLPQEFDYLLFSYHSLPKSHLKKADPTRNHCMKLKDCCAESSLAHLTCYRYQAFSTSQHIAKRLQLDPQKFGTSFQSRVGPTPWLTPRTDEQLVHLARIGVRDLAVACPSFIADNLETIEEIGITGKQGFLKAGGRSFTLLPCLNADPTWIKALSSLSH